MGLSVIMLVIFLLGCLVGHIVTVKIAKEQGYIQIVNGKIERVINDVQNLL